MTRPTPLVASPAGDPAGEAARAQDLLAALPSDLEAVALRDGARTIVAAGPQEVLVADGDEALCALDDLRDGWWAGFLSYDLGRAVERVEPRADGEPAPPDLALARFDARVVIDPTTGARIEGTGESRALLERALDRAARARGEIAAPALGPWRTSLDRTAWEERVRRALDHIAAGDCYQVNLTRRLTCERAADPAALFAALARRNPAPHAAFVRLDGIAVVSASPERFLRRDGARVETRPIKGTARDPAALRASEKDRAENVMIVDLARNDLGRVCEYGTVRVPSLCAVEAHPGLYHLVSTVTGRLRPGTSPGALIRATFPPASVTGAPKPRVMQIIEDLEGARRGVYCGAVGWIDADRHAMDLNVAIRTFTIAGGATHLGVGAGIVADSDPAGEWDETALKAARLLAAAGGAGRGPAEATA